MNKREKYNQLFLFKYLYIHNKRYILNEIDFNKIDYN